MKHCVITTKDNGSRWLVRDAIKKCADVLVLPTKGEPVDKGAAWSAAWSAAYYRMSRKLIALMEAA
jgi:hypothetical protein